MNGEGSDTQKLNEASIFPLPAMRGGQGGETQLPRNADRCKATVVPHPALPMKWGGIQAPKLNEASIFPSPQGGEESFVVCGYFLRTQISAWLSW